MAKTKKIGFTLAEVLVTLAVIGIVAALTVPSLVKNISEAEIRPKLKKVYSMMSQAAIQMSLENGGSNAGLCDLPTSLEKNRCIRDKFGEYLSIVKKCSYSDEPETWDNCFVKTINDGGEWVNLDGANPGVGVDASAVLKDGTLIHFWHRSPTCTYVEGTITNACTRIYIDINGFKGPNVTGKDIFLFYLEANKLTPYGDGATCSGSGLGCTSYYLRN